MKHFLQILKVEVQIYTHALKLLDTTYSYYIRLLFCSGDEVHKSSTWVKVQIHIIKYYSSKSKSTAFSILLEWKYKSTQLFM